MMILKWWLPYKGILNVPLIFKVPGVTKAGGVSDSLVSAVDLAPTILRLMDEPAVAAMEELPEALRDAAVVYRGENER